MSEPPVNGNISEIDGPYYPVRLQWIPRAGDLIDLTSFIEARANNPSRLFYEVVRVIHQLYDVTEKDPEGHHFVTVVVRRTEHSSFEGHR